MIRRPWESLSAWYDARLSVRYDRDALRRREQLKDRFLRSLTADIRSRFGHLEMLRNRIAGEEFRGKRWYRQVVQKIDDLLEKFLMFAQRQRQFAEYIDSVRQQLSLVVLPSAPARGATENSPVAMLVASDQRLRSVVAAIQGAYKEQVSAIDADLAAEQNPHNQALLDKRRELLDRRSLYIGQIGDILLNLGQQLQLIEDTLGLINDEIRARSPEQVLADIDEVVVQTDKLNASLLTIQPLEPASA